jgi:hypothetical protein
MENGTVARKPRKKQPKLQIIDYPEEEDVVVRLVYEHYLEKYNDLLKKVKNTQNRD